jgi:hypothetical protein
VRDPSFQTYRVRIQVFADKVNRWRPASETTAAVDDITCFELVPLRKCIRLDLAGRRLKKYMLEIFRSICGKTCRVKHQETVSHSCVWHKRQQLSWRIRILFINECVPCWRVAGEPASTRSYLFLYVSNLGNNAGGATNTDRIPRKYQYVQATRALTCIRPEAIVPYKR